MQSLEKRFLDYISYDTESDPSLVGKRRPTTEGQERLLEHLRDELESLGLDVYYGSEKVVRGYLKGNAPGPAIAFMAHVDTSDETKGNGVKPIVHRNYSGGPIKLQTLTIADEDLELYKGGTIITSDGTTLLGADDKAGCAIIMEAVSRLIASGEKHPDIEVYFTPDEETGSGMNGFPVDMMKAVCCYTIDGGREGEIEAECFNGASVKVHVKGNPVHLGYGRGRLVNAVTAASRIVSMLPGAESPEATDGRYGYYYPLSIKGCTEEAELEILIRDFSFECLNARIEAVKSIVDAISRLYHAACSIDSEVTYRNMMETAPDSAEALGRIFRAGEKLGIPLYQTAIRGGTDGAWLAERGIPSPNIFTGGHSFHSNSEWIALEAMERATELVLGIIREAL